MKKLITILFVCLLQSSFATTYYIAANGNDANNGTAQATPWQTLSKVNATSFQPGDNILFRRGDTFYGKIILPESPNSVNITFGAYGSGNKPIITGFTSVTSWTNKGGNIWESTNAVSPLSSLAIVTINGQSVPMGRYPNADATYPYFPNFYNFQSHTGTGEGASSITSSSLTDGNNWAGADVVIRMNQWTFHKELITSQSGTTLSFNGVAGTLEDNWGFWIQNDIRTLDQQSEWYYNPSSNKISIYSTTMPTNVQVSTVDTLFYFYSNIPTVTSVTLDNLQMTGANGNAVWISGNLTFSVTNCDISYNGFEAIMLSGGGIQSGTIDHNTFYANGASGIFSVGTVNNLTITNNNVKMSSVISAIQRNMYSSGGIEFSCDNSLVQYNVIDSSAYCGINFNGANTKILNNFINHSAIVRGDAAGIYTGYVNNTGKVIDGNIVLNSQGNPRGSRSNDYFAMGIYCDDLGNNLSITNNFIANARTAGIYLHNSNNLKISNNIIYNCGALGTEVMWANGGISMDGNAASPFANSVHDNLVSHNQVYSLNQYQYNLNYYNAAASNNDPAHFGIIDSNYYVKVNSNATAFKSQVNDGATNINGLSGWTALYGKDAYSSAYTVTDAGNLRAEYNETNSSKIVSLGANYKDVKGATYSGSITLQPYSGAVLIYDSPLGVAAPTMSISGPQSITVDNTTINAVATWDSGHTGTYQWTQITGAASTIETPTNFSTKVSGLKTGTYKYRCTITQDDGQTTFAEVTITVNIPNVLPTVNAGVDITITLPTNSVSLSGSATDSDGSISAYLWTKISGIGGTITTPTSSSTTVTGLTAGLYIFQLQVTDNSGATATDTVQINVNDLPPVSDAGKDQMILLNNPIYFKQAKEP